jgi:hypothetical protein
VPGKSDDSVTEALSCPGRFLPYDRDLGLDPSIELHRWPYTQSRGQPVPMLYCYSPAVVPKPPDWSEHVHVTDHWFLDHAPDSQPPADLVDFLGSGPPP